MSMDAVRRFYAEEIRAVAAIESDALIDAFARVPREHFLGPGPWQIAVISDGAPLTARYRTTPDADPAHLHHNVVVAIDAARQLNNGQPTALAMWIDALGPRAGERVVHLGAGVGYYSAVIAEVVGAAGRVTAIEIDPELAVRARALLARWPWVDVVDGDGSEVPSADAILVNAGCTRPRDAWLAALGPGGRLVLPLTTPVPGMPHGVGAMVKIVRGAAGTDVWPASLVSRVGIYDCAGAREDADQPAIMGYLRGGAAAAPVRSFRRAPHELGPACVLHNRTYCLSSAAP
jgi:protein-L-isoaspartate(D-aspartate) O-methyltransferase